MPPFLSSFLSRPQESRDPLAIAAPSLIIRNLTAHPFELRVLERFKPAVGQKSSPQSAFRFGRNLTHPTSDAASTSSDSKQDENAQPTSRQDIENVSIQPFTIVKTEFNPPLHEDREVVRLTFEVQDQRFRMDCPSPTFLSQTLQPLAPDPKFHFTGVFLPRDSFVCIFSSADLDCWMRHMSDATPLSALSIPGTHNSPTCYNALPSVRCQAVSIREQLDNGVRFLDVRVQPDSPKSPHLVLVHSAFSVSLTRTKYFRELEETVVRFLEKNPTETIILSLKREGTGRATDPQLATILMDHYASESAPHCDRWYTNPQIPTLSAARGKIVLLRRFKLNDAQRETHGGRGFGIDASSWADNTPYQMQENLCVQDFYEVLETVNIEKKIRFATDQAERAGDVVAALPGATADSNGGAITHQPLYLNFLSASNFFKVGCWPDRIAAKLNPAMVAHLCLRHHVRGDGERDGDGGTGIIVCDYVGSDGGDWDLVKCIVGCNTRLMVRELKLER